MIHDPEIQLKRKKAEQEAGVAMAIKLCRVLGDDSLFFQKLLVMGHTERELSWTREWTMKHTLRLHMEAESAS